MQHPKLPLNRGGWIIAVCLLGAVTVQTAMANCPPGYRAKAGHCIPGPAHAHHPYVAKSNVHVPSAASPLHAKPHALAPKAVDRSKVKPQPGAPIERHADASNTHGIIFVGGKNKAALNPQPIPPGHAKPVVPTKSHGDLKANKKS